MKNLFLIIILAANCYISSAQAPQNIPYQAVIRNSDGSPMASATVTLTFSIHNLSAAGDVVYQETHSTTANTQGLVSLNIGAGNPNIGSFSAINWGSGAKFLQVAMNAGNGNIDLGTQQMMSVPYTLYAENTVVKISNSGDTLTIGGNSVIVPGISLANPVSTSNYGSVLLPGNTTCQNEYISVTGCGGQDSLLYYDRYYSLTEIGGQCWFAENLATDKYSNGDVITTGLTNTQWQNATAGAYAIYNNDLANDAIYGKLYNWYTTVDSRGVCPTGWHVPSDCDWMFMEYGLSPQSTIGGKIKSISGWQLPNSGANNISGFTGLPGGMRGAGGGYSNLDTDGIWYSSSESSINLNSPIHRQAMYNFEVLAHGQGNYRNGFSIRCIKD